MNTYLVMEVQRITHNQLRHIIMEEIARLSLCEGRGPGLKQFTANVTTALRAMLDRWIRLKRNADFESEIIELSADGSRAWYRLMIDDEEPGNFAVLVTPDGQFVDDVFVGTFTSDSRGSDRCAQKIKNDFMNRAVR